MLDGLRSVECSLFEPRYGHGTVLYPRVPAAVRGCHYTVLLSAKEGAAGTYEKKCNPSPGVPAITVTPRHLFEFVCARPVIGESNMNTLYL